MCSDLNVQVGRNLVFDNTALQSAFAMCWSRCAGPVLLDFPKSSELKLRLVMLKRLLAFQRACMSRHVWMRHWEEVCEQHVTWCERCSRNASGTTWWAGLSARCGVCINQRFLLYLKQDLTRVLYALAGHVRQSQVWPALRNTRTSRYQGNMYSVVYFPQHSTYSRGVQSGWLIRRCHIMPSHSRLLAS